MRLEILPVLGIGDVTAGDDLAALIATAAPWLRDGDVLVVTSKIVSKAEGRLVDVPADGPERFAARDEVLAAETARVVATRGATRIVQTHHGFVLASAGIDASNVEKTRLVLLPEDPDASARALRAALRERYDVDVAVIVSDTMGRPWRNGLTDVALGVAGLPAIRDHRGEIDPYGNELHVTQMAVVDELAGAGELIKGKCDQVPVAVVRGYLTGGGAADGPGARALVRDAEQDLFALGTAEAKVAGMLAAATLADGPGPEPADPAAVRRAIDAVADSLAPGTVFTLVTDEEARAVLTAAVPGWPATATGLVLGEAAPPVSQPDLVRFGADTQRLRAALAAHGVPSLLLPPPADSTASAALAI
ncbi:coenzyme F420-0:L-glutamate ligase [Micromonospora sagamiensis]|uniref:Coenzyme F420-0:L-glutamate ligase/coenzyme F420-1:gamma-L-glutamate ligase n=1 Tax=Micromonospora sagamiensis TaxID=47875 RepID=A0A562WP52_9ACTN|nr:coenzyme F420-0:L-glutamate ligase [Micromonospora sagamiensis]TWJ31174.1 coenzyme F420-0:L-glutamate ligase/coenzyme F420-1:gamma-L-glutamate ligase [Micromonospora sagamiensis]BCL15781.1 coenzyme F420:L-glutamate ligase [Micromonospora sagamiensis]